MWMWALLRECVVIDVEPERASALKQVTHARGEGGETARQEVCRG